MAARLLGRCFRDALFVFAFTHCVSPTATAQEGPPGVETIVVVDRALRSEIDATPGGITLVDADELRERKVSSLADMLRYVPGVWAESSSGADAMFFSSRGSNLDATGYDGNGLALLQDGLPVTTADGNNHNRVLDPLSARFATVARGANALKYGAATLGGAIDFNSPTARNSDRRSLQLGGGSNGQRIARGTFGAIFDDRFDGLITIEAKRWDGYRDHSAQTRNGLYANVGLQPSTGTESRFFVSYVENDEELPGYLTREQFDANPAQPSPAALTGDFRLDVESVRLANRTTTQLGASGRIDYGFYLETQSLYHPIVDVRVNGTQVFGLLIDTEHRESGGMFRYAREWGAHDVLLGVHYATGDADGGNHWNDGGERGFLMTTIDRSASSLSLYALDRWQVTDRVLLELGAHGLDAKRSVVNVEVEDGAARAPSGAFSHFTPRAGLIYAVRDDIDLFASLSGLYEPPTNYELEDEASGGGAILRAMSGTVLEIGTRGRRTGSAGQEVFWEASLYYARVDDEILSIDDPTAPGTSLSANVDATTHAGIEAALGAELPTRRGGVVAPRVSVAINEFAFAGDAIYGDNDLPGAPAYVVRAELMWRLANGLFIGPTFDAVGERFADFANRYRVGSHSLLGLRAGWSDPRWTVFAELVNAADERYAAVLRVRETANADADVLSPGAPRSLYVGVQGRF